MMSESGYTVNRDDDADMLDSHHTGSGGQARVGKRLFNASNDDDLLDVQHGNSSSRTGSNQQLSRSQTMPFASNSGSKNSSSGGSSPPVGGGGALSLGLGMCGPNRVIQNFTHAPSKMEFLKEWSVSTYKCTRQAVQEKLGKSQRTVDVEIETAIEELRGVQNRYQNMLRIARAMSSHFAHVVETQRQMGECMTDMATKETDLQDELKYNAETQRMLVKNGESLLGALEFFVNTVNTLCNKTMEDTLMTVKNFEAARLEYDAYRCDLEALQQSTSRGVDFQVRLREAQDLCTQHKQRYEQLRDDVHVKIRFLSENKVKVMQRQLVLFHNAISSYFSGNQGALEQTLKQFGVHVKSPNATGDSFLEQS